MRVRAITPILVDDAELARRQERYDRLSPAGWRISLENLPDVAGTPHEMSSADQIRDSETIGAAAAVATDGSSFDAVLPDCVLDPGLEDIERDGDLPAIGITRLSAHFLAACGRRFGVVTRNEAIGDEYRRVIERYALTDRFDGVYVLGLDAADISDREKWNAAIERVSELAHADGTTLLINGCSAVEVTFASRNVTIVDPTALALRVAGLATELGIISPGGAS